MNVYLRKLVRQAEEGYMIPIWRDDGTIDLMARGSNGDTLLHVAVGQRDFHAIEYLLKAGLDINAKGDYHATPLYEAAARGDIGLCGLLLQLGADPNIPDHRGTLPHDILFWKIKQLPAEFLLKLSTWFLTNDSKSPQEAQQDAPSDGDTHPV
jgi:Ankyrin repeats (3 copies)